MTQTETTEQTGVLTEEQIERLRVRFEHEAHGRGHDPRTQNTVRSNGVTGLALIAELAAQADELHRINVELLECRAVRDEWQESSQTHYATAMRLQAELNVAGQDIEGAHSEIAALRAENERVASVVEAARMYLKTKRELDAGAPRVSWESALRNQEAELQSLINAALYSRKEATDADRG